MVTSENTKTRLYEYMSKLWLEHESLSNSKSKMEASAASLRNEIKSFEKKWLLRLTSIDARKQLKRMKMQLKQITSKIESVVNRCLAITKATDSWSGVFYA